MKHPGLLMEQSSQNLAAAKRDLAAGVPALAVSRVYYAMFHAAEAALAAMGACFSSHGAVIAAFGKELAKTGKLPSSLHRDLIDAFARRNTGEYGDFKRVSHDEADRAVRIAGEFVSAVEKFLKEGGQ